MVGCSILGFDVWCAKIVSPLLRMAPRNEGLIRAMRIKIESVVFKSRTTAEEKTKICGLWKTRKNLNFVTRRLFDYSKRSTCQRTQTCELSLTFHTLHHSVKGFLNLGDACYLHKVLLDRFHVVIPPYLKMTSLLNGSIFEKALQTMRLFTKFELARNAHDCLKRAERRTRQDSRIILAAFQDKFFRLIGHGKKAAETVFESYASKHVQKSARTLERTYGSRNIKLKVVKSGFVPVMRLTLGDCDENHGCILDDTDSCNVLPRLNADRSFRRRQ